MKPLLFFLVFLSTSFSLAQLSYRGEVEVATDLAYASVNQTLTDTVGLTLRGHFEADYFVKPLDFRLVLDPTVRLTSAGPESALVEPGLTEAFALYRFGNLDLSAGLERLPLQTARLSVPFRVEPVGKLGQPLGLLGVRANVYLTDWRVRPALLYRVQDDRLGGVLSVRREFASFDLEAHVLYLDGFTFSVGGSGLIGDIVVYGEAWLLTNPWDGRGALGLSGFAGDLLWTLEAAYAADPLEPTSLDPDPNPNEPTLPNLANAYPQLSGQFSLPVGDGGSVELNTGLGLRGSLLGDSSALQASTSLFYRHTGGDYRVTAGPTFNHTELATVYGLRLSVTTFF